MAQVAQARVAQLALVLGLMQPGREASAQEATSASDHHEPAAETRSSASTSDVARSYALELAEQASALYDRGDFDAAIALLVKAYAEFPEPVLLYDIGRAHEGLGEDEAAIDAYEKYLDSGSATTNRGAIERRLQTLRQRAATTRREAAAGPASPPSPSAASTAPPPASARSDEQRSLLRRATPWVVTGVGALTLATGGVLWRLAVDRHELAQAESDLATAQLHQSQATTLARAATVATVIGGVLTAAGATWTIVTLATSRPKARHAPSISLGLGPCTVHFSSRF